MLWFTNVVEFADAQKGLHLARAQNVNRLRGPYVVFRLSKFGKGPRQIYIERSILFKLIQEILVYLFKFD